MMILICIITLAIAVAAQWQVKRMYKRFSLIPSRSGYTGAEAARAILQTAGIADVKILEHEQIMGDHYDPRNKRLVLSSQTYHGTSLAALGVAAHEAGHALQHKAPYAPLQLRMAAVGVTHFASQMVAILPLVGIATGLLSSATGLTIMALAWSMIMVFNLVTLPVEFDASRRARQLLTQLGFITGRAEQNGVSQVLNAAAMTYVAAFVTSLLYMLGYLLPLLAGGRQRS